MLCAIYCRLSKEDEDKQQHESESIQNQKSILVRYAVEHGWDIYNLYCDEDYSGADALRPDFRRMLNDAEAGRFQIVLCKTQSRFTRDMELVEKYIHGKFPLWGIRFVAIADNVDTEVRGNKKARQINGLINEWYLEDLSENIRMVFDNKRRQGQYIGGFPIYGYQKDPANKHKLVIDEEAATVVRQIYAWYLSGTGAQHIAYRLNEAGYDNPTKHKQKLGMGYINGSGLGSPVNENGLWNKLTVARILHNEMYTGVMVQGRTKKVSYKTKQMIALPEEQWYRVPNTHEAIIDADTFERVQTLMRLSAKSDGLGEYHVLSGLVKCADCGSTLRKTANCYKGKRRVYMRCSLSVASAGRALCSRHSIRFDRLLELVTERLRAHVTQYYELGNPKRFALKEQKHRRTELLHKELQGLEGQISRRSEALKNLYLDKVSGILSKEQFLSLNQAFIAEKENILRRQAELKTELGEITQTADKTDGVAAHIEKLLKLDPAPRDLFAMTIDKIEVGEKDSETGRQEVRIHWKF